MGIDGEPVGAGDINTCRGGGTARTPLVNSLVNVKCIVPARSCTKGIIGPLALVRPVHFAPEDGTVVGVDFGNITPVGPVVSGEINVTC